MNAQLAPKYFPVKVSRPELFRMSEWAIVALYSKYKSVDQWESAEAFEYAYSIHLAATASALSESACDSCSLNSDCPINWTAKHQEDCEFWEDGEPDEADLEINSECTHRIMNGYSSRCFCGNHSDFAEVLYV